jgi:YVTN family beta-propeller protein
VQKAVWSRVRSTGLVLSPGSGLQSLKRSLLLRCEWLVRGLAQDAEEMATERRRIARSHSFNAPCTRLKPICPNLALLLLAALAGCGGQYRPVVSPVQPTGPAPQPVSNLVVTTTAGNALPGLGNVFDGSGDALLRQVSLGSGPIAVTMDSTGTEVTNSNFVSTLNSYAPGSSNLETNQVFTSTLIQPGEPSAQPINLLATTSDLFVALPNESAAAVLSTVNGVDQLIQQLPMAGSPINFAGNSNAQRIYAISQDNGSNKVAFGNCETPTQVSTPGQVKAIEIATLTESATLPVGICPVYGIASTDNNRTFILNRGSGTVTVINSQLNQLDNTPNLQNLNPATGTLTLPAPAGHTGAFNAGPVFADYYAPSTQLVTANYDSNTISVINVGLDLYGNDTPNFGQTVTIPVGNGPTAVTILRDGSRAYVANQNDSTVTVVNLTTFTVETTVPVTGHPISIASIDSTPFGQIFVLASDQPYMTVIRTDTDQVNAVVQLDGTGVDVHASTQLAGSSSSLGVGTNAAAINAAAINVSHSSGSGSPCGYCAPCYASTPPCP